MKIIDLHCDVLLRLYESKGEMKFQDSLELDTSYEKLIKGGVKVQAFAIFVYPEMKSDQKFQAALDQIHYFYSDVLWNNPNMKLIKDWKRFRSVKRRRNWSDVDA